LTGKYQTRFFCECFIHIDFFLDFGILKLKSGGRMKRAICIVALAVSIFLTVACGDQPAGISTPAEPDEGMTPHELGVAIGTLYIKAMEEVTTRIKDKPDPADIKAPLQALKEKYIGHFIRFGKTKSLLPESDHGVVDSAIRSQMAKLMHVPWYKTYNDAQMYYHKIDPELRKLILDFNIITQYADFELLKKQAPEEAKRLGIK
jgi:hypothetical protein